MRGYVNLIPRVSPLPTPWRRDPGNEVEEMSEDYRGGHQSKNAQNRFTEKLTSIVTATPSLPMLFCNSLINEAVTILSSVVQC